MSDSDFRKKGFNLSAWLILGVLAIVFGLSFGLPSDSLNFGKRPYVVVHGKDVRIPDWQYQLNAFKLRFNLSNKDPRTFELLGLHEEVLESVVERLVLYDAADDLGMSLAQRDAEELTEKGQAIITGDTVPWLKAEDTFDYETFTRWWLRVLRVSEQQYLEIQRQELLARTVRDLIHSSVAVPETEIRKEFDRENNTLSLRYVRFATEDFVEVVDPKSEEIDAYVESHKDELAAAYEKEKTRFIKLPAQSHLRVIQVRFAPATEGSEDTTTAPAKDAAQKQAKQARSRILGGESFASVARELSQDDRARAGGDYGWVDLAGTGTGLEKAVDEAARELKDDKLSEVIEGEQGYYIVLVEGRREGDLAQEVAIRELATDAVKRERAAPLAKQAAQEALLNLKEGKTMSELYGGTPLGGAPTGTGIENLGSDGVGAVAARGGPSMRTTGAFPKDGSIPGLGEQKEIVAAAWDADPSQEVIDRLFEVDGAFVVTGLEEKKAASDEDYANEREAIYRRLAARKSQKVTAMWAKRRCLDGVGRGEIRPDMQQIKRLMIYDSQKDGVEAEGSARTTPPYSLCARVGNRGNMFRGGFF